MMTNTLLRPALLTVLVVVVAASGSSMSGQTRPTPQPATYVTNADLMAALTKATAANPDMSSANIKNSDVYRINIVRRGKGAGAMAHVPGTELHYILEGAGTLATGGHIVRPTGGGTATIEGGEARRVAKGDAILIPENTPHWYKDVEGSITYLEVRFNVPVKQATQ